LGSTGRTEADSVLERLTMQAVRNDPSLGKPIIGDLGDSRWTGMTKMQYVVKTKEGVQAVIHYIVDNPEYIKFVDDIKFINQ